MFSVANTLACGDMSRVLQRYPKSVGHSMIRLFWCSRPGSRPQLNGKHASAAGRRINVCCPRNGKTGVAFFAASCLRGPLCFFAWEGVAIGPVSPDTGQNRWMQATGVCRDCLVNSIIFQEIKRVPIGAALLRSAHGFAMAGYQASTPVSFDRSTRGGVLHKKRPDHGHQQEAVNETVR
jgi:hypothetical protein